MECLRRCEPAEFSSRTARVSTVCFCFCDLVGATVFRGFGLEWLYMTLWCGVGIGGGGDDEMGLPHSTNY